MKKEREKEGKYERKRSHKGETEVKRVVNIYVKGAKINAKRVHDEGKVTSCGREEKSIIW